MFTRLAVLAAVFTASAASPASADTRASYTHEVRSPVPVTATVQVGVDGRTIVLQRYPLGEGESVRITIEAKHLNALRTGPAAGCDGGTSHATSLTIGGERASITVERLRAGDGTPLSTAKTVFSLPTKPVPVTDSICLLP